MVYEIKSYWFHTLDTEIHLHYLGFTCLTGSVKLTVSMVSSTLRTLPKKSVIRTLPGLLRNRSVRWPGVDTHWLLGQTLNCEHKKQATTVTNLFKKTKLQSYLEIHNIGLKYCKNNEHLHRKVAFCQCITAGVLQLKKKPKSSIIRPLLVGCWRLVASKVLAYELLFR